MTILPLCAGRLRAVIAPELGAGIADFSIQGPNGYSYPIMRRACPGETSASLLGSFIMAPWVNRIAGATFVFAGKERTLRANNIEGTAQHGDVRHRAWTVAAASATAATLSYDSAMAPDSNWPWSYRCAVTYQLASDALSIALSVTNTDREPFPAGCGHHPYFMRRLWDDGDVLHLRAAVRGRYPLTRGCATGPMAEDVLSRRLCELSPIPEQHVDDVFGGFGGEAELRWPASGVRLRMTASPAMGHLVLYAPHAQPGRASPISNVAVEPQTQVNDAFNLERRGVGGVGTVVLTPGATLETVCRLEVEVGA